jgi:transglutaminase-like putative cysteine protease
MTANPVVSSPDEQLRATGLLDFSNPSIQRLVDDDITASNVLADGYGQCNTKATLLMTLLRAVDVPCRFHATTIHKRLQRGVVTGLFYRLGCDTEIQMTGVHSDLAIHNGPDTFYETNGTNLSGVKGFIYRRVVRRVMNRKAAAIRAHQP